MDRARRARPSHLLSPHPPPSSSSSSSSSFPLHLSQNISPNSNGAASLSWLCNVSALNSPLEGANYADKQENLRFQRFPKIATAAGNLMSTSNKYRHRHFQYAATLYAHKK
jgi:hypothetical protein